MIYYTLYMIHYILSFLYYLSYIIHYILNLLYRYKILNLLHRSIIHYTEDIIEQNNTYIL